jgi:hypothetical protein
MVEAARARRIDRDYSNLDRNARVVKRWVHMHGSGTAIDSANHPLFPYLIPVKQQNVSSGRKVLVDTRGQVF